MAGIYIHIPFCGRLCTYCDFHFSVSMRNRPQVINAIVKEISLRKDYLGGADIETLYFGGGTPTVCEITELRQIRDAVQQHWDITGLREFTVEANPEDLSEAYLVGLKAMGVTRLSIGIQSFDDDILRLMNRRHDAQTAYESVERARRAGFDNISLDLIYGIDTMSADSWQQSVETAVSLNPEHLSAYHLTIDSGSVLAHRMKKKEFREVDETIGQANFDLLTGYLTDHGFEHYEVSNFARPGFRALHNANYWKGIPYLGAGPSAHSFDGNTRSWNISSNRGYAEAIEQGVLPSTQETLTLKDRYNEYVMLSLRTAEGADASRVSRVFGAEIKQHFDTQAHRCIREGLLQEEGTNVRIESRNFLLSDAIITQFFLT